MYTCRLCDWKSFAYCEDRPVVRVPKYLMMTSYRRSKNFEKDQRNKKANTKNIILYFYLKWFDTFQYFKNHHYHSLSLWTKIKKVVHMNYWRAHSWRHQCGIGRHGRSSCSWKSGQGMMTLCCSSSFYIFCHWGLSYGYVWGERQHGWCWDSSRHGPLLEWTIGDGWCDRYQRIFSNSLCIFLEKQWRARNLKIGSRNFWQANTVWK